MVRACVYVCDLNILLICILFSFPVQSATRGGIGNVFNKLTSKIGDPVDFELPDWLSKWQPTPYPYTSIRRSILQ